MSAVCADSREHGVWRITGLDCPDCARAVAASIERLEGVICADLNFASGTLLVGFEPGVDPRDAVVRAVVAAGHGAIPIDEAGGAQATDTRPWIERNLAEVATLGSGLFAVLGAALGWLGAPPWMTVLAYAISIVFGGLLVWRRAVVSLKARMLDMNVLMTVAVFGAAALGQWGEGATVYFLFALGGLLESRSLQRTRRSIRDLMDLAPAVARVRRDGAFVEVAAGEVAPGEMVRVRPGERVPLDGVIARGSTTLNEAPITGESAPAEKTEGDTVFAGTLNETGLIEVDVTARETDSALARIVFLVEEAQAARAPSQQLVDRFARVYTPSVVVLAAAVAVVPPLAAGLVGAQWGGWAEWIGRALVLLVIGCPCALVLSTPVSIVSAITRASRDGVLVKGGVFLEIAAKVDAIAFDKTGTLTAGRLHVESVVASGGRGGAEVLALASRLESHSNHPMARAVVRAAGGVPPDDLTGFAEQPGGGVSGMVDGVEAHVGSPTHVRSHARDGFPADVEAAIEDCESVGRTALVVLDDGRAAGVIGVADALRPETAGVIGALERSGVRHLVMLTGDNERVAARIAQQAGLTEWLAGLLPADKTAAIDDLKRRFAIVAMVGDGINDAPALAASHLGIAMGAAGSDTALETADVALMRDDLTALPGFLALGRRTMHTIVVNIAFSIAVKVLFLGLALAGVATLWMAVFADTGVSLLVILNGMRLLRRAPAE